MMRACVREGDAGLRRQPFRELVGLAIESSGGRMEYKVRPRMRLACELEDEGVAPANVARPRHVFSPLDDARATCARCIADDVENRGEERTRVVSCCKCVPEERDRVRRIEADGVAVGMLTPIALFVAAASMGQRIH